MTQCKIHPALVEVPIEILEPRAPLTWPESHLELIGIGIDICEGERFAAAHRRWGQRLQLKIDDQIHQSMHTDELQLLFSLKEAVIKALGANIPFRNIFIDDQTISIPRHTLNCHPKHAYLARLYHYCTQNHHGKSMDVLTGCHLFRRQRSN